MSRADVLASPPLFTHVYYTYQCELRVALPNFMWLERRLSVPFRSGTDGKTLGSSENLVIPPRHHQLLGRYYYYGDSFLRMRNGHVWGTNTAGHGGVSAVALQVGVIIDVCLTAY